MSRLVFVKLLAAALLAFAAVSLRHRKQAQQSIHRRLSEVSEGSMPSYLQPLMDDLEEREKLFRETPEKEVKYWFEYTGPLQVSSSPSIRRALERRIPQMHSSSEDQSHPLLEELDPSESLSDPPRRISI